MLSWKEDYNRKLTTAEEAAKLIESDDILAMSGGTGIPTAFSEAMARRAHELHNVKVCQGFAVALHDYMKPEFKESFRVETIYMGPAERACLNWGTADFVPNHLGSMAKWADHNDPRKAVFVCTPPDENGYMNRSLFGGLLPDKTIRNADIVVAEVNANTPWLVSDDFQVHVSQCTAIIENNVPIFEIPEIPVTETEERIAGYIADMVPDGATIQLGMGGLANCVGHFLKNKRDLGVHSEVVSNSIMELVKCGAVNNSKKTREPGISCFTFAVGTRELFDYLDHNKLFKAYEIATTNDPNIIAQNDNMVSVNNALMVDLTGQVASESIGTKQYSATGGQVNFVLGAQRSKNGKSILALPSTYTDSDGTPQSRILATLPEGTVVTTSRNDVQWIVTEYGGVCLSNRSITWRAKALIELAHPDFRDELTFRAKKIGWI